MFQVHLMLFELLTVPVVGPENPQALPPASDLPRGTRQPECPSEGGSSGPAEASTTGPSDGGHSALPQPASQQAQTSPVKEKQGTDTRE